MLAHDEVLNNTYPRKQRLERFTKAEYVQTLEIVMEHFIRSSICLRVFFSIKIIQGIFLTVMIRCFFFFDFYLSYAIAILLK